MNATAATILPQPHCVLDRGDEGRTYNTVVGLANFSFAHRLILVTLRMPSFRQPIRSFAEFATVTAFALLSPPLQVGQTAGPVLRGVITDTTELRSNATGDDFGSRRRRKNGPIGRERSLSIYGAYARRLLGDCLRTPTYVAATGENHAEQRGACVEPSVEGSDRRADRDRAGRCSAHGEHRRRE